MAGFPGNYRHAPAPHNHQQTSNNVNAVPQPPPHNYQQLPQYGMPQPQPVPGYAPPQSFQPQHNGGMPQPLVNPSPYGPPQTGYPQNMPPRQAPIPPPLPVRAPQLQQPYNAHSLPAPYTPNTHHYDQPLHHQTQYVPSSSNVPSSSVNVEWVNNIPRLANGSKKALLIGINYKGQRGELKGCHADVNNVKKFLIECYGFVDSPQTMVTLTDEPHNMNHKYLFPTRKNILAAMNWLVQGCKPGDSLFFHYSGHGGQQRDTDGDEEDGYDETILPVDHSRAGMITDDEMHSVMVKPLPEGARLTALFDSCHSGTALDLPIVYMADGQISQRKTAAERAKKDAMLIGMDLMRKNKAGALMGAFRLAKSLASDTDQSKVKQAERDKMSKAQVIMFSGCKDSQTSADAHIEGKATGAMSWALLKSLKARPGQSYTNILSSTRDLLRKGYSQKPQLSSGHPLDMDQMFLL